MLTLTLVGSTTAVPSPPMASAQDEPDLILHDAIVITMDPDRPSPVAVAVAGDRITGVGSDAEILALAGPDTTVVDLDGQAILPGFIDSHAHWIGDLDAAGDLRVRVNGYLPVNYGSNQKWGVWFRDYEPGQELGAKFRLAGVKFFIDGCFDDAMLLSEPHHDTGELGSFYWTRGELNRLVRRVHEAGWQIAAHACGDGAIDHILDALERAFDGSPGRPFRARVEHVIVLRDDQLRRMRRFGASPSFQLTFVDSEDTEVLRRIVGADRLELLGPVARPDERTPAARDREHGFPVGIVGHRSRHGHRDAGPGPGHDEDRRTGGSSTGVDARRPAHARSGPRVAHRCGRLWDLREDDLGAIKAGMLADLVVLSEDPHDVPLKRLTRLDVVMVFVGGRLEICAHGYESLCPDGVPVAAWLNGRDA